MDFLNNWENLYTNYNINKNTQIQYFPQYYNKAIKGYIKKFLKNIKRI